MERVASRAIVVRTLEPGVGRFDEKLYPFRSLIAARFGNLLPGNRGTSEFHRDRTITITRRRSM
jgi:hypothetical protein